LEGKKINYEKERKEEVAQEKAVAEVKAREATTKIKLKKMKLSGEK
jgi:hypothetical protein